MSFSAGSSSGHSPEINVTPLIDVLLVLLIIFMVVRPSSPHGLQSVMPKSEPGPANEGAHPIKVTVLASHGTGATRYRIGQNEVSFAELQPRLHELFKVRADRTLYLEADRALSYRDVAIVAGEGRAAGAETIALTHSD